MTKNKANNSKPQKEKLDPMLLKVSLILVFGSLAPLLDTTMVNVAIKTLSSDLKSTVSVIQWVVTGYVLAMAMAVPISGWAINRFGGKRLYQFSLVVFLAGSILSALSWNIGSLIGFRILQGIGAGLLMPTMTTMLFQVSGGRNMGRMASITSIPMMLAPILGPVLGGIIVNSLGWRWIFYVNIPVTIIALLLALWGIPKDDLFDKKQHLDIIGILILSPAFALLIYGIAKIASQGGLNSSAVLVPIVIGLLLMIVFVVYALRTRISPVLDLQLFRSRNFSASTILLFMSGFITNGGLLLLPLYYQQVRGESVLFAGLLLIPQGIGMLLTRSKMGKLTDQIGARPIVLVSLVITSIGTLPFAFANSETNQVLLAVVLLIRGAGLGGVFIPIMVSAYMGLSNEQIPHASIATRILQTIGGAFGSAILATIVQHQIATHSVSNMQNVTSAYNVAFWWIIGFTVIAIIPTLFLTKYKKSE
ncbi:multidrug export protein EmrB [Clostridium puniceum]|uniref:Multidrug export protein EmrB n=1 Tax=Clostridium puniceum TaxID=29367 RepID=A0A1S8T1G9_9CLOT|nr:MDR family MFS transporter [Clostridium puniceum]OOM71305.1 multidrug export protein EmrB [Clostridium puniceum]